MTDESSTYRLIVKCNNFDTCGRKYCFDLPGRCKLSSGSINFERYETVAILIADQEPGACGIKCKVTRCSTLRWDKPDTD